MTPAQSITEALDPILAPAGFVPGHGSDDPVAGQVIFCAGHDEFAETLRSAHLERDAAAAGSLTGDHLGAALPRLGDILGRLFAPTTVCRRP
ncbi:hypothetical protein ACFWPH_09010 [Nocardia sp. NPDC058499]|uniref:hypothetical protein n=1 Tax=Nocardia sp. NPDC058499 TaxID=3346530 RepID=UPI00364B8E98